MLCTNFESILIHLNTTELTSYIYIGPASIFRDDFVVCLNSKSCFCNFVREVKQYLNYITVTQHPTMAHTCRKFRGYRMCKTGEVPLSIMDYSYCIQNAFIELLPDMFPHKNRYKKIERYKISVGYKTNKLFKCKKSMSLMTLCLQIALFIEEPNYYKTLSVPGYHSIVQSITYYYGTYLFNSSNLLIENISKEIASYLMDKTFQWIYSKNNIVNAQFEIYSKYTAMTTDAMSWDAICLELSPKINLFRDKDKDKDVDVICFQMYILGKSDEMWIGICNQNNFGDDLQLLDRSNIHNRIAYYAGRYGSNDKSDHWDGYFGSIQGMKQLMATYLESYGEGDWITIVIDRSKYKISFFKNKRWQSAIGYKKYRDYLGDDCILYALLDAQFDGVFIEQTSFSGTVWENIYP